MFEDGTPLFVQLADQLAGQILVGDYAEGDQVPSINELAAFHRINPATANRAVSDLVAQGILVKRRGVGMFVADGAREAIASRRRAGLVDQYIRPLIEQASALGITPDALLKLIAGELEK